MPDQDPSAGRRLKRSLTTLVILLLLAGVLWLSYQISWRRGLDQVRLSNQQQLDQFVGHLDAQLARFQFLPQLVAKNQLLVDLLQHPDSSPRVDLVNHLLEDINQITGASDTYLMDHRGLTLAASNWKLERTFIGRNFGFRPYFKKAMQGQLGRYFALGTTSRERGYYYAYPITYAANVIGVIVIKMDLTNIEQRWSRRSVHFMVTDQDSIVFITTQPDWLYLATRPLSPQDKLRITQSRRYSNIQPSLMDIDTIKTLDPQSHIRSISAENSSPRQFLVMHQSMPMAGWDVHILAPLNTIRQASILTVILVLLSSLLLLTLLMLAWQRHRRRSERERFQMDAQRKLEQQVDLRTRDLKHEIEEHKLTEQALRETQGELIQTAKLAVLGQMSASISHELNNPLAAIRSYADNARQFLKLHKTQPVDENLTRIAELTERMAKISSQLKFFARKSSGNLEPVLIRPVIQTAIDIIKPQYKNLDHTISIDDIDDTISILADTIQLEQVLINLLNNALNAIDPKQQGLIRVHGEADQPYLLIHVDDNGCGIEQQFLDKIFDPFFTTRKSGLGLGLSISARIMEGMNGELSASNLKQGGARFTLRLKMVDSKS